MAFQFLLTLFIFLSFIISSLTIRSCSNCLEPWREYDGHCYVLVKDKRNFQDAEKYCYSLSTSGTQSHLITIASEDENLFLKNYVIDELGPGHFALWIGLNDRATSRRFDWVDGSGATYRNFKPGEPSHSWREDCVVLWYGEEWNDFDCFNALEFVCKKRGRFSRWN